VLNNHELPVLPKSVGEKNLCFLNHPDRNGFARVDLDAFDTTS